MQYCTYIFMQYCNFILHIILYRFKNININKINKKAKASMRTTPVHLKMYVWSLQIGNILC